MVKSLKLIIVLFFLLSLTSCTTKTQLYQLSNLDEEQQLLIQKKSLSKSNYGLLILGKGELDGEARIALLSNSQVHKVKIISGNVKFQWREKWQDNRAIIRYQPVSVTEGNLRVSVTFIE
jgi:cell division protein FtsL